MPKKLSIVMSDRDYDVLVALAEEKDVTISALVQGVLMAGTSVLMTIHENYELPEQDLEPGPCPGHMD